MKLLSKSEILAASRPRMPRQFIYFLLREDVVVYVGQSETPLGRIAAHSRKNFDAYAIVELSDGDNIDDVERQYILDLEPEYNVVRRIPVSFLPCGNTAEERVRERVLAGQAPGTAANLEGLNITSFYRSDLYYELTGKPPRRLKKTA